MGIKTRGFYSDVKSVEKVFKKCTKIVINKNVMEICTFPLLLIFVKLVLPITFFSTFLKNFFKVFDLSFLILSKKIFTVILVLFSNFEARHTETATKSKNVLSKYVLDLNFAPIKGLCS
jgi:hypothetical protein